MKSSLFEHIPELLPEELITVLARNQHVRVERIVSDGHASPQGFWYNQSEHEWVLLLSGSATLAFENGTEILLNPGDYLEIPAHQRHRVEATSATEKTVWLAVFFD